MSVEKRLLRNGRASWRVRWREGGRNRARAFAYKRDADAFDVEIRRRERLGELGMLDAGRETLADFAREWWRVYAEPNLARTTLEGYAFLWDRHVLPRLGGFELRRLTPEIIEGFRADLERAGVGPASVRKTLTILQGVLQRAVVWGRIPGNPAAAIRKPSQRRVRLVRPLAPTTVEAIRARLLRCERRGDAALVSVLAYAGLRPGEALALRWGDVRERTLVIERAIALGEEKTTKTGRARSVRLLAPLASDLAEWRLASGRPDEGALVFPARSGGPWSDFAWRNWRRRIFTPVAAATGLAEARARAGLTQAQLADRLDVALAVVAAWEDGSRPLAANRLAELESALTPAGRQGDSAQRDKARLTGTRPYDLRHSFVSLLLADGASVIEVAQQAGHSPTMSLNTYGHVIEELAGAERRPAEETIREAREALVPLTYPRRQADEAS